MLYALSSGTSAPLRMGVRRQDQRLRDHGDGPYDRKVHGFEIGREARYQPHSAMFPLFRVCLLQVWSGYTKCLQTRNPMYLHTELGSDLLSFYSIPCQVSCRSLQYPWAAQPLQP